jgi:murein DD-endopeptidase MepM/ murein hydrolase activator NlpD
VPDIRLNAVVAVAAASAVALSGLALPGLATAAPAFGERTLKEGMSGKDVREMQRLLRHTGARISADGEFGAVTARALRTFERSAGLTADARLTVPEAPALEREAAAAINGQSSRTTASVDALPSAGGASPVSESIVGPPDQELVPSDTAEEGVFPIRAKHDLSRSATNNFGGGRGHQGQDVFARCGAPVVAAMSGTVDVAKYHGAAGNHVVITTAGGESHAYMHLREPAVVEVGDEVGAGQAIGNVGSTGRASGCHLHFELWTAPGYYKGGQPVDPLPTLRRWDRVG